jgi:hypothetical protein
VSLNLAEWAQSLLFPSVAWEWTKALWRLGAVGGRYPCVQPVDDFDALSGGWPEDESRVYYRNALPPNWVDFNVGFGVPGILNSTPHPPGGQDLMLHPLID